MRHFLLLAVLFIMGCAAAPLVAIHEEMNTVPPSQFEIACEMLATECAFAAPLVVISGIVPDLACTNCRYEGVAYDNEPYIFISSLLTPERKLQVEFHEVIHYIVAHVAPFATVCESESLARTATALQFGLTYSDDWREWYGCELRK